MRHYQEVWKLKFIFFLCFFDVDKDIARGPSSLQVRFDDRGQCSRFRSKKTVITVFIAGYIKHLAKRNWIVTRHKWKRVEGKKKPGHFAMALLQWPPLQWLYCNAFKSQCFASPVHLCLQIKLPSLLMTYYPRKYMCIIKGL